MKQWLYKIILLVLLMIKKVIASSDIEFMKSVLQMKESTPLDYEEIVQIKMEAS